MYIHVHIRIESGFFFQKVWCFWRGVEDMIHHVLPRTRWRWRDLGDEDEYMWCAYVLCIMCVCV